LTSGLDDQDDNLWIFMSPLPIAGCPWRRSV